MLDISYVRKFPDVVRENIMRRNDAGALKLFEDVLKHDRAWRDLKGVADSLRARRNKVSQEINIAKKSGKDASDLIKEVAQLPKKLADAEEKEKAAELHLRSLLLRLPNLLHESVPFGKDDSGNVVVRTFGEKPSFSFKPVSHVDLLEQRSWADTVRAAKISGARWFFLKGDLAVLELALVQYAMDFMRERGFTPIIPPFMMSRSAYEGVTSLDDFENVMYKVEGDDLYAIATSEHPLTAMYRDEIIETPIKLAGFSTNFRKEVGTHGKDEKGIFRVHQFNKVEQIVFCRPQESWKFHEELLKNASDFFESLGLHCRVVNICTGDIGIVAAKKYDIEAWFPLQNAYREVVSCSNCTSYQTVRSNIRFEVDGVREFAHSLNSTCVATTRALAAIIENFQRKDGSVSVPKVLQKYCGFKILK